MKTAHIRREYEQGGLRRADLDANPLAQFEVWFAQASAAASLLIQAISRVDRCIAACREFSRSRRWRSEWLAAPAHDGLATHAAYKFGLRSGDATILTMA